MYFALEYYPLGCGRKDEHIYMSHSARSRVSMLPEWETRRTLTLERYLDISERYGWLLSRDINFMYAYVLIPPSQTEQRLRRLMSGKLPMSYKVRRLSKELGYDYYDITAAIYYRPNRKLKVYAGIMYWIAEREQREQLSDALDIEI